MTPQIHHFKSKRKIKLQQVKKNNNNSNNHLLYIQLRQDGAMMMTIRSTEAHNYFLCAGSGRD